MGTGHGKPWAKEHGRVRIPLAKAPDGRLTGGVGDEGDKGEGKDAH